jgi:hypothetical protein
MAQQIIRQDFGSWSDFVETAADPARIVWAHDYARLGMRTARGRDAMPPEWWGETFAAAIDLARFGWPAGREAIMQAMAIIFPEREATPERFYDVAGAYPDVPRAVAGDPVAMVNLRPSTRAARPVVRIDYGRSTLSNVPPEAITNRGAALLGIVDALESRGYSVELRLVFKTQDDGWAYHSAVVLKQAGEPLDIDRAAFALINPAVLRRLSFAMREQHKPLETAFGSSMGVSDYTPLEPSEETIFVPAATGDDLDPERARRRIEQLFAEARP